MNPHPGPGDVPEAQESSVDQYFAGHDERSRAIFDVVRSVVESIGPAGVRVSTSQIAFRGQRVFASTWVPSRYLRGRVAPLVLTIGLHRRDGSRRWKQVVEARPGRFTHHLELCCADEVDADVRAWLREAWDEAK